MAGPTHAEAPTRRCPAISIQLRPALSPSKFTARMLPNDVQPEPGIEIPPALIEALRNARRVVVLTGAGISAESGVPTFRDAQTGIWAQYRPEELATPDAFRRNPRLVWEWYAWRRDLVSNAQPNPG